MIYTLLYISTAERAFNNNELEELVSESRTWNSRHGITGFLAYVEGVSEGETNCQFIQVVEGEKKDMEEVLTIIKEDPRHKNICVIKEGYINERKFDSWNMGFECLNINSDPALKAFFSMNLAMLSEDGDLDNNILMRFMKAFYDQKEKLEKELHHSDNIQQHAFNLSIIC
jgi:hypothetical protein